MVFAIEREDRGPRYEVHNQHGLRMAHTSWQAICQCCWGWIARTLAGREQAEAWHARRFGRGRTSITIDGITHTIVSWAVISDWHVVLFLEGGGRVELNPADEVVASDLRVRTEPVSANARDATPPAKETLQVRRPLPSTEQSTPPQPSLFGGVA